MIGLLAMSACVAQAQMLFAPLRSFAEVCVREKTTLRVADADQDEQFRQLYSCLEDFSNLPIQEDLFFLHASFLFSEKELEGHIVFSPDYVADYLTNRISDPRTKSVPYIRDAERRVDYQQGKNIIVYGNCLAYPEADVTFAYHVDRGEQQLVVVAEDDTPLEIEIRSESGYTAVVRSDMPEGFAQHLWEEAQDYTSVHVSVRNPAQHAVSFVIAVH